MTNVDLARIQFAFTSINHFFFVPVTIGLAFLTALLQTAWYRNEQARVPAADPVLRHAAADQRRDRRGHRAGAGVRVRDELGGVLAAGRQRLRRAAGDGGAGRVLPGVDVPRAVAVRVGQAAAAGAPGDASGRCRSAASLSAAFILAANSWMQHPVGYMMVHGKPQLNDIWALFTNPVFVWGYAQGRARRRWSPARWSCWPCPRGSCARRRPGGVRPVGAARADRAGPGDPVHDVGRRRARGDRGQVPADEDRRGGGAVDHLPAVLVLAVPDRRRQQRRDPDPDHRDPAPAVAAGHQPWNGQVVGLNPLQQQYSKQYGPGNYVPNVFIQYWGMRVMAYLGGLVAADIAVGAVADPAQDTRHVPGVPVGGGLGARCCRS